MWPLPMVPETTSQPRIANAIAAGGHPNQHDVLVGPHTRAVRRVCSGSVRMLATREALPFGEASGSNVVRGSVGRVYAPRSPWPLELVWRRAFVGGRGEREFESLAVGQIRVQEVVGDWWILRYDGTVPAPMKIAWSPSGRWRE